MQTEHSQHMSVYKLRDMRCVRGEHEKCPGVSVIGYRCECECHCKKCHDERTKAATDRVQA